MLFEKCIFVLENIDFFFMITLNNETYFKHDNSIYIWYADHLNINFLSHDT